MELFEEESQEQLKAKWHEKRSMGIGGSEIGVVLGQSPYKSRYVLWLEKTKRVQQEDISGKFHVQRGVQGEIVARAMFEEQTGLKFEPRSWVMEGKEYIRCNDDGWNEQWSAMLEIKTMSKAAHDACANGEIPQHYLMQLQYNMGVAKALVGYFISYRPEDKSMHVVTVNPDTAWQEELVKAAEDFWLNHVMKDEPPELTDDDYASCIDPEFELLSDKYKRLKADLKMVEEELEIVESGLHEFLGTHAAIRQNGILMQRITKKGNVNYKAIPELKGVDLEKYRAPSSTYIAIKGVKS